MKVRNGFVSNSSSASFTLTWELREPVGSVKEAVEVVLQFADPKAIDEIAKNTKELESFGHNLFKTHTWTTMFNSWDDFPDWVKLLFFAVSMSENANVVETVVEEDN
jgi:hypothetical protein